MGATATGKTDLALHLYENINCEIVSVDSAMVYRGLDIGTAKPDRETLDRIPHHLIDICEPTEAYSAARFQQNANALIKKIIDKGKLPLLVGGTGLYFRALERGLSELPGADYHVRARIKEEAERTDWQSMHKKLRQIDPEAAARISENDPQRIQRALEVYEVSGKTLSSMLSENKKQACRYSIKKMVLLPNDRSLLHRRIKKRLLAMLKGGLVEEVEHFHKRGDLFANLSSMRLVGYRQIWNYLDGDINYQEMQDQAIAATRQMAKRQITWFRHEDNTELFDPYDADICNKIINNLVISN